MAQKIRKGKRRWYPILAPKVFDEQQIGETFVYETEAIEGKHLTINLQSLTSNPKKQNMNVFFKVTSVEEGVAKTKTRGIEMQKGSTKRLVRRGRSKVSDSFRVKTKRGQIVRVKPIVMTRSRATADVQRAIRQKCRELIRETFQKYNFDTIVSDVANNRLQRFLKDQLSALFPVRSADIRSMRFEAADNEAEDELEETQYEERPKREREKVAEEGLASLKSELDEALAAEKEEVEEKEKTSQPGKKKAKKKAADDDDDDDADEEQE